APARRRGRARARPPRTPDPAHGSPRAGPGTSRRHDGARSRGAGRSRRSRRRDRSRGGVLSWIGRRERGPALHHGLVEVSCTCRLPTVTAAYSVTMPSSPPSVRPVLAALLTVLLLTASALVSGPA